MADYVHRIVTTRRHIWALPDAEYGGHGVAIEELHKAFAAAEQHYRTVHGKDPRSDDWLRVWAADDEVLLWFDEEVQS